MNKTQGLGPAPWRPSEETDQPPAARVLGALAEHVQAVTTAELVDELGLHANTVRGHLQELVAAGLALQETVPPAGRGRPAHRYRITDEGRDMPRVSDPAFAEYRGLTTAFATHLAARSTEPSEEARAIGYAWGAQLASADTTGAVDDTATERMVRLLAKLGFSPVPSVPTVSDGEAVDGWAVEGGAAVGDTVDEGVALRTCPLLEIATQMPDVICQVHLGLVQGAMDEYGAPEVDVQLHAFNEPGACRLHLREAAEG